MDPETLAALANHVTRNGVSSARVTAVLPGYRAIVCRASDGSVFVVTADRDGNAYGWADDLPASLRDLAANLDRLADYAEARAHAERRFENDENDAQRFDEWERQHRAAAKRAEDLAALADMDAERAADLAA